MRDKVLTADSKTGKDQPETVASQSMAAMGVPHVVPCWMNLLVNSSRCRKVLETDIRKWINEWNKDPRPFVWTKTADEILETLAAYCQRISETG